MRKRIEIPDFDVLVDAYKKGRSVKEISSEKGLSPHMLRRRFAEIGVMRSPSEATPLAFSQGKMNNRKTRKGLHNSEESKANHSTYMRKWHDKTARGWRINSRGYVELTRGDLAGKLQHVKIMEERIGRSILADECVHHIDRNKLNNDINNLALLTLSAHGRLHRYEDAMAGIVKPRSEKGQFRS